MKITRHGRQGKPPWIVAERRRWSVTIVGATTSE